jgi:2-polyprenyl-6-hydroxyphenyl methylase/3-demethylubiquinone-9 3-methyltransferase
VSTIDNAWWDELADDWWDPAGPVRALHEVNPVRLDYFLGALGDVRGKRLLDLGCGAGLMMEAYAAAGADAIGIDLAQRALRAGRRHARDHSPTIIRPHYVGARAESLPFPDASFDAVCTADALLQRNAIVAGWRYARGRTFGGFALSDDTRISYVGYAIKPSLPRA